MSVKMERLKIGRMKTIQCEQCCNDFTAKTTRRRFCAACKRVRAALRVKAYHKSDKGREALRRAQKRYNTRKKWGDELI